MKNIFKNTSIVFLVVFVGITSYYIPLKVNNIDPRIETYTVFSNTLSYVSETSFQLLATVAGSTKSIKGMLNGQPLNIFTLEPLSYLKLQAPIFDLLPLFFSSSTKTTSQKNGNTNPNNKTLDDSLNQTSAPIIAKKETKQEDAIVNIFCSQKIIVNGKVSNQRRTITGSGVLINKDGTVLTNAHVGQFPLLSEKDPNVVCLARYGNPASGSLSVKVSFISPEWIKEYGKYVNTEGTAQTGKSDFALLKIGLPKQNTNNIAILSPIVVQKNLPAIGDKIFSISYPADILGTKGVGASLPMQKEQLAVNRYYSVGVTTYDVLETTPSTAGQRGSSGGAIVDEHGHFIGTITTIVNSTVPSKKNIRAMTVDHTDTELLKYSNTNLTQVVNFGSSDVEKSFNLQYRDYLTSLLNTYLNSL
ncbi:MAG: serine protease [Candidatus Pacebacteria bacterium]|nr:serine protease [Candidatus Paceibacterota bacterium]